MYLIPSFFCTGRSSSVSDPFFHGCTKETTAAIAYSHKDWKETPEEHVIKVDLLGLKRSVVKVWREARLLEISVGRSNEEKKRNHWRHHRTERSSSDRSFFRRYRVPENAIVDKVKILYENGFITFTFPKEEIKKPVLITGLDK